MASPSECPYAGNKASTTAPRKGMTVRDWWPESLDLRVLHQDPVSARPAHVPHPSSSSVAGAGAFPRYAEAFSRLDLNEVRSDLFRLMTDSRSDWPADYGHYGPLMVRLAWHAAGTYRTFDGRGGGNSGSIRLAPLNSWPDNANLDKSRRLLWPIKKKYGSQLSWGDLFILAGNAALESMGLGSFEEPLWFGGGRVDAFAPEDDVFWGDEAEWLKDERHRTSNGGNDAGTGLKSPLGAVQMGLIYVNPEGPGGNPDILASARDIRETFARMGMDDAETIALIAGGHTFGKAHGAADPSKHVGPEPEGAPIEQVGLGWKNTYGSGKGADTITSGLEGAWTARPTAWDNGYFDNLFGYEWTQTKSPGGATQWIPTEKSNAAANVPDAHDAGRKHVPIMFTTDLALRYDAAYGPISERFHTNPGEFEEAFKRAWYKLTHRDMGPKSRHLGPLVPKEDLIWLDPIPNIDYVKPDETDIYGIKSQMLEMIRSSKVSIAELVKVAWASASTYRFTDYRGGANGGRIRLDPQRTWAANDPQSLDKVLGILGSIQQKFNMEKRNKSSGKQVSMADLIILGGSAAIEEAARRAGHIGVRVPFVPGRVDASQSETDVQSFGVLEPFSDGFRNFHGGKTEGVSPEASLVDKAHLLTLSTPEMAVLVGGLRVLNANTNGSDGMGVLTDAPETLTNDFFVNLLDENTSWSPGHANGLFSGSRGTTGKQWIASRVDLVFASNSQLRAISETYACDDSRGCFVKDFIGAWTKVMNLDRFELLGAGKSAGSPGVVSKL